MPKQKHNWASCRDNSPQQSVSGLFLLSFSLRFLKKRLWVPFLQWPAWKHGNDTKPKPQPTGLEHRCFWLLHFLISSWGTSMPATVLANYGGFASGITLALVGQRTFWGSFTFSLRTCVDSGGFQPEAFFIGATGSLNSTTGVFLLVELHGLQISGLKGIRLKSCCLKASFCQICLKVNLIRLFIFSEPMLIYSC